MPGGGPSVLGGLLAEDVAFRIYQRRLKHAPGPVVPPVVDHPRLMGVSTGSDHAVARRSGGVHVGEPGILHPRAAVHEPSKAVFHEEVVEALKEIVAELVDDDQHREPGRVVRYGRGYRARLRTGAFLEHRIAVVAGLGSRCKDEQQRQDQTRPDESGYGHNRSFLGSNHLVVSLGQIG